MITRLITAHPEYRGATVKGIEMDLTMAPVRELRVTANYSYLHARYNGITSATGANVAADYRFTNAPAHTLALDVTYDLPPTPVGRLSANANYTMQSDKFTNATITGGYVVGDYGLLNARLALTDIPGLAGVRVALWARNLADKEYYLMQFNIGRPGAIFGEPRTYGIDLSIEL